MLTKQLSIENQRLLIQAVERSLEYTSGPEAFGKIPIDYQDVKSMKINSEEYQERLETAKKTNKDLRNEIEKVKAQLEKSISDLDIKIEKTINEIEATNYEYSEIESSTMGEISRLEAEEKILDKEIDEAIKSLGSQRLYGAKLCSDLVTTESSVVVSNFSGETREKMRKCVLNYGKILSNVQQFANAQPKTETPPLQRPNFPAISATGTAVTKRSMRLPPVKEPEAAARAQKHIGSKATRVIMKESAPSPPRDPDAPRQEKPSAAPE